MKSPAGSYIFLRNIPDSCASQQNVRQKRAGGNSIAPGPSVKKSNKKLRCKRPECVQRDQKIKIKIETDIKISRRISINT